MKSTPQKILDWTIEKINRDYPGQICLLIENTNLRLPGFDQGDGVDYFIPEDGFADTLSRTFIIDGVGYDLYPRSWQRIEEMSNLDDYNPTCLADAVIVWARSPQDRERFEAYRERLRQNLADPEFVYRKALEKLDVAQGLYQKLLFEPNPGQARLAAGYAADYLSNAIAFLNHTYFRYSQVFQLEELETLEKPEGFSRAYEKILLASSIEELRELAGSMVQMTRKFVEERRPPRPKRERPNFKGLADWYQELSYTWLRIAYYTEKNDPRRAFAWGIMLQEELSTVAEEFQLPTMDLLSCYDAQNLAPFAEKARELEQQIRGILADNGISLAEYRDFAEFAAHNP